MPVPFLCWLVLPPPREFVRAGNFPGCALKSTCLGTVDSVSQLTKFNPLTSSDDFDSMFLTDRQLKSAAARESLTVPAKSSPAPRRASGTKPAPSKRPTGSTGHTSSAAPASPRRASKKPSVASTVEAAAVAEPMSPLKPAPPSAKPSAFDWGGFDQVASLQVGPRSSSLPDLSVQGCVRLPRGFAVENTVITIGQCRQLTHTTLAGDQSSVADPGRRSESTA